MTFATVPWRTFDATIQRANSQAGREGMTAWKFRKFDVQRSCNIFLLFIMGMKNGSG
jgi:hypothetical protein